MLHTLRAISEKSDVVVVAREEISSDLWHKCLGHMSEKGLKILTGKNFLPGLKSYNFDLYEHCIYGRQRWVPFIRSGHVRNEKKPEPEVSASAKIEEFVERHEREFYLMNGPLGNGCLVFEDIEVWFVDNRASRHMTGMRLVFSSLSETNSDFCVGVGTGPQLAVKGVGSVRFQLESGGFLEVFRVLYVPEMMVNLLSVSPLEVDGFGVVFYCGRVFLYPEGATPDIAVMFGVGYESLYRFLGRPVLGSVDFWI
jgi:hypothetical protein